MSCCDRHSLHSDLKKKPDEQKNPFFSFCVDLSARLAALERSVSHRLSEFCRAVRPRPRPPILILILILSFVAHKHTPEMPAMMIDQPPAGRPTRVIVDDRCIFFDSTLPTAASTSNFPLRGQSDTIISNSNYNGSNTTLISFGANSLIKQPILSVFSLS